MQATRVAVAPLLAVVVLCAVVAVGWASTSGGPEPILERKLLSRGAGETVLVDLDPPRYERALLELPKAEEGEMVLRKAWEINATVALKLSGLPRDDRWRVIRRNLEMEPKDEVLWEEVADVIFEAIHQKASEGQGDRPALGLRVAFAGDDEPEVALALNGATEKALKTEVLKAMTGVEGFVELAAEGGIGERQFLRGVFVSLLASDKKTVLDTATSDARGYFCFSGLEVDEEFGRDYYLKYAASSESGEAEPVYVPVTWGGRTRVHLRAQPTKAEGIFNIDLDAMEQLIFGFRADYPLLEQMLRGRPRNRGLHAGVAVTPDDGIGVLYAVRYPLRAPVPDRGPKLVSEASMRLEHSSPEGLPERRYLRIVLVGQATEADLDLQSRPLIQFPWGVSLGVMPSTDPALYCLAASYEWNPALELVAGFGIQDDEDTSFVYGVTFDLGRLFGGILAGEE